jgi:hypothetical protein
VLKDELLSIGWLEAVQRKFQDKDDVSIGRKMLEKCAGIEIADSLSIDYIDLALRNLSMFPHVS